MAMQTHKDLDVWKEGIDLVVEIYRVTKSFPKEEVYGITSQMRRASVSIPSNIAEGYAKKHIGELVQYLYNALASVSELETQLIISTRLEYLDSQDLLNSVEKLRRMLLNLIRYQQSKRK
jgi:four helix bundle protein